MTQHPSLVTILWQLRFKQHPSLIHVVKAQKNGNYNRASIRINGLKKYILFTFLKKTETTAISLNEFQCRQYCYRVFHIEHVIRREVIRQGRKEVVKVSHDVFLHRNVVFAGRSKRHFCNKSNSFIIKECKKLRTKKKTEKKSNLYSTRLIPFRVYTGTW